MKSTSNHVTLNDIFTIVYLRQNEKNDRLSLALPLQIFGTL